MVSTGLEQLLGKIPEGIRNKKAAVLCHAPSITPDFKHISEHFSDNPELRLGALFGPQHGLFGQTQDNMIEWEGYLHPRFGIPVFSLYGEFRKPTRSMLDGIEVFIADLQDVGARLYTYIWTLKLCMEACAESGIPVWVTDRPNPVAGMGIDGPVLNKDYFTFVGGAEIPLCHSMTIGEMAVWIKNKHIPSCELHIVKMQGWRREMFFDNTGLPWVMPSPNMPALSTAIVYPGMVLSEALNLSEGRGTTLPFEIGGAPWIKTRDLLANFAARKVKGCSLREHDFIPTFHKFAGETCRGFQMHVTDRYSFRPVEAAVELYDAILETSDSGKFEFKQPPYEYEEKLMPFDILAGDWHTRNALLKRERVSVEFERWKEAANSFNREFSSLALYD